MATITLETANEILEELRTNGQQIGETEKLSHGMSKEVYEEVDWKYIIFFDNGQVKKIEAGNHRELIEKWVR